MNSTEGQKVKFRSTSHPQGNVTDRTNETIAIVRMARFRLGLQGEKGTGREETCK